MKTIRIKDLDFVPYINEAEIFRSIDRIAEKINTDYKGQEVLFVGILNGAFIFASDLIKRIDLNCKISFVKLSSYNGTETTGQVKQILGLSESIKGKHVIIIEDIVDTGITINQLYHDFLKEEPASLEVCTLLLKPEKYSQKVPLKYVVFSVPNEFVVGYGFDYDGYGRNIPEIYQLKSEQ